MNLETITEYWPVALAVLGGLLVAAKAIAAKTKTKKDDQAVEVVEKIVEFARGKDSDSE